MTTFYLDDKAFIAEPGETVLDTLIRCGYPVSYSCKKGRCRSCLLQYISGDLCLSAQRGLEPEQKKAGVLFACQCIPSPDLVLGQIVSNTLYWDTQIHTKQQLTETVISMTIKTLPHQRYQAGQCVNLRCSDGIARTYAIAEVKDEEIEIHVRCKRNGQFSQWLCAAEIGEKLQIQGPWGHCHYFSGLPDDILVLIGSGTALGAVAGIAKEALLHGHKGDISLYHYGRNLEDLYLHKDMLQSMLTHKNFFYQACISAKSEKNQIDGKRVCLSDPLSLALKRHAYDRKHRVFLCGDPLLVAKGQEQAFLAGVPIERIHVLSFDYKELRKRPRSWY